MEVIKLTNRNATKRLKMKQEMCVVTRNGKIMDATLKQIASQEF